MWFLQKSGFAKNPQIHFYKYKTFLQIQNIFTNTKHFYKYKQEEKMVAWKASCKG